MARGAEKTVLDLMHHEVPFTTSQIQSNLPEDMRGNKAHQTIDRLKRKGLIYPVPGTSPYQYLLAPTQPSYGERESTKKPRVKKVTQTTVHGKINGSPMPQQMTKQLNLRLHQKERAISFEVEGWSIRIGFEM